MQVLWIRGFTAVCGLLALFGCSGERSPAEVLGPSRAGDIVVDAVLLVGETLPRVVLTRTTAVEVPWDEQSGIVGAEVFVETDSVSIRFVNVSPVERGIYAATGSHMVLPETEYRLRATTPRGDEVRARTLTPASFTVQRAVLLDDAGEAEIRELAAFRSGQDPYAVNRLTHGVGRVEARVIAGSTERYQVGLFSLDLDSDFVVDVSFLPDDAIEELLEQRNSTSPALVAENDGIRLPWAAVVYEGRYLIRIHSIDENWYDLIRSSPEFGGGPGFGGNAGDSFDRPLFHVEGGIGLFGSGAVDSVGITVLPVSGEP